jgi:predicted enzyme related to lactoylglutathione lyase
MAATDDVRLKFDHVSIAVKSIDRAYEFFEKYFPIKLRSAKTMDEQVSGSFYWQDFHLGGFVVELIEDPPGKPGFVTKFIASSTSRSMIQAPRPRSSRRGLPSAR